MIGLCLIDEDSIIVGADDFDRCTLVDERESFDLEVTVVGELSLAEEVESCDSHARIAHGDRLRLFVDMRIDLGIKAQTATDRRVPQQSAEKSQEEHLAHEEASRDCASVLAMG